MSPHEIRLHEAHLLALVSHWHIVRQDNCSNAFQGACGAFRLELSLYSYEMPAMAHVCARIFDEAAHNPRVSIAVAMGASVVEAVEEAVSRARELGYTL